MSDDSANNSDMEPTTNGEDQEQVVEKQAKTAKRGRGRPPKGSAPAKSAKKASPAEDDTGDSEEDSGVSPVKKSRGRPPKKTTAAKASSGEESGAPKVKRGRGRPPKAGGTSLYMTQKAAKLSGTPKADASGDAPSRGRGRPKGTGKGSKSKA